MKMTSINIRSGVLLEDAQEVSSEYFGGNILFDRAGGMVDVKAFNGARLEKVNISGQLKKSLSPSNNPTSIGGKRFFDHCSIANNLAGLIDDWQYKFPTFEISDEHKSLIENLFEGELFEKDGWHIRIISELITRSASFSCFHFVSFVMHRRGIVADRTVYKALSSSGFFRNFEIASPEFGVSKYTPDYFSSYISDSLTFSEAIERARNILMRYCIPMPTLFDALSSKAISDQNIVEIFHIFGDHIESNGEKLLTEEFFRNIEGSISKYSTLSMIFQYCINAVFSMKTIYRLTNYDKSLDCYDGVVELMSGRGISINEEDLAAWVLDSPSLEEALRRVRLAFRNNPPAYERYSSSLGDWVTTSDEFALLKKLDEELIRDEVE